MRKIWFILILLQCKHSFSQESCKPKYELPVQKQQLSGLNMAYVEKGKGQPVVFIHGLGGNLSHWTKAVKKLSATYKCIAVDLPGYGYSDKKFSTNDKDQLQFYADMLTEFIQKKNLKKIVVAGHSFVVSRFPVYIAIVLVLGMLSAGMATLEGLIQSISTSFTSDVIKPITKGRLTRSETNPKGISELLLNRVVIGVMAVVAFFISYQQLLSPDLSVGIFAQNGVYAYFSAVFVPVLFGIFVRNVPRAAVMAASVTAVVVHFSIYYGRLTPYMKEGTRNPGIASAMAIVASLIVAVGLYFLLKKKKHEENLVHTNTVAVQA